MPSLKECHVCGSEVSEGFKCIQCGLFTCSACGDSDLCNYCLGDEIFLADILDIEE